MESISRANLFTVAGRELRVQRLLLERAREFAWSATQHG